MGTRNLTFVVLDGAIKVAQYGQWDGHPSGQGSICLDFLKTVNIDAFKDKVRKCSFFTTEQLDEIYDKYSSEGGWMNMEQAEAFKASDFGYLSRDTGADILEHIMKSPDGLKLADKTNFAVDGLFCEWAYLIDLDKNVFEVYRGFHQTPVPKGQRFEYLNAEVKTAVDKYYPIHLAKSYSLDNLPEANIFIKECEEEGDE